MGYVLIGCSSGQSKEVMPIQDYPLCLILITRTTSTSCQSIKWQIKEFGRYIFSWPYPWSATNAHLCSTAFWGVTLLFFIIIIIIIIFFFFFLMSVLFVREVHYCQRAHCQIVLKIKSFLPSTSKNCKRLFSSCFLRLQVIGWCHFQLF